MPCFRRRIEIVSRETGDGRAQARCALEDDFHHFRVAVEAEDSRVTTTQAISLRNPNSLCPAAGDRLAALVGMALSPDSAAVLAETDQFQQCTHQLDMAGLAIASLALGRPRLVYDIVIPDRVEGRTQAQVFRDGEAVLAWDVAGMTVEGPEPYAGRQLGAGFTRFTRELSRDAAEAALVFRRALFVSQGRGITIESLGKRGPVGGCWAWQPERIDSLHRLPENRRDFGAAPDSLCIEDRDWLAFGN